MNVAINVAILFVILILMLFGGGYSYRRGNNVLAVNALIGLIIVVLLFLYLLNNFGYP